MTKVVSVEGYVFSLEDVLMITPPQKQIKSQKEDENTVKEVEVFVYSLIFKAQFDQPSSITFAYDTSEKAVTSYQNLAATWANYETEKDKRESDPLGMLGELMDGVDDTVLDEEVPEDTEEVVEEETVATQEAAE